LNLFTQATTQEPAMLTSLRDIIAGPSEARKRIALLTLLVFVGLC